MSSNRFMALAGGGQRGYEPCDRDQAGDLET
jgi:hypothetical protein